MKKIFLIHLLLFLNGYLFSQSCDGVDMEEDNYLPNLSLEAKNARGDYVPEYSCWKSRGKIIGIGFTGVKGFYELDPSDVSGSAKLSITEKKGRHDYTVKDFEPLEYGYNKATMDPLDPGNPGARGLSIFLSASGPPTNKPEDEVNYEYYYHATGGANYPKSISSVGAQGASTAATEYVVNTKKAMMSTYELALKGKLGVGDSDKAGFSIGGGISTGDRFGTTANSMIGIYIEKTINNNIRRTNFSSFKKTFLNAIEHVDSGKMSYKTFFETWGTHYATSANLGSSKFKKETYSKSEVQKAVNSGFDVNAAGAYNGVSASMEMSNQKSLTNKTGRKVSLKQTQATGGTKSPIEVELYPIYELLKAIKDSHYSNTLYSKMKSEYDRYYAEVAKKNGDMDKTFISPNDLKVTKVATPQNSKMKTFLRPVKVKFGDEANYDSESGGVECEGNYYVKVNENKKGTFGHNGGDLDDGAVYTKLEGDKNYKNGEIYLGDYSNDENIPKLKFDLWEYDNCGSDKWTMSTSCMDGDDDYANAEEDVKLGKDNKQSMQMIGGGSARVGYTIYYDIQRRTTTEAPVTIYQHGNYGGMASNLVEGSYDHWELQVGNDEISSIKVKPGYKVIVYQDGGYSGSSTDYEGDVSNVGGSWNDKISSIKVVKK